MWDIAIVNILVDFAESLIVWHFPHGNGSLCWGYGLFSGGCWITKPVDPVETF